MVTGMSSGVELPPRRRSWSRAWVTTAGRPTRQRGRARPQKTTLGWRGSLTPEPNPGRGWGEEPRAGVPASECSQTLTELVTVCDTKTELGCSSQGRNPEQGYQPASTQQ